MKVTVWRNSIKEGLDITERATTKSTSLPILQNISLVARKDTVEIASTDLQIGVTHSFPGKVEEEGRCVFPGHFLSSLLGVFSEEQISLKLEGKHLLVSSGKQETTLNILDPEEFPIIPSTSKEDAFVEVEAGVWSKGLGQVVGMVGQSQTRPEISGVLVVFEGREAKLVATDSFRLAEKTILLEKESNGGHSFILPQKTARELIAILGEKVGGVRVFFSPTQAVFDYMNEGEPLRSRTQIVSRLIEGEYPRYEDVIPSSKKTKLELSRAAFLNNVKAAGIFAGKTNEVRLRADPAKKQVSFFSENSEAGKHSSVLAADVEGEEGEVAFNWRFLADGLVQIKGESVEFSLNGEDGPALLQSTEQEGYRYVLMPIKAS